MKKRFKKKNIKQGGTSSSNYQQQGFMCIKSLSYGILLSIQLEAVRLCLVKKIKRKGVVWVRIQCVFPVTKKSLGSRMGKGVGPLRYHVANIKRGSIILEFQSNITQELVFFLKKLVLKLPVKSRILLKAYY